MLHENPNATEQEVHELTHLPPKQWCSHRVRGTKLGDPHKRVALERAESTLPVIAFDFCVIKTSGSEPGTVCRYWCPVSGLGRRGYMILQGGVGAREDGW